MRKTTKIWLVTAASLAAVGLIVFSVGMAVNNWDFDKLSTEKFETNTHEISQEFSSISIDTDTADITFALSDDGKCKVECYEEQKANHSVTVQEDTLNISVTDNKSWYDYIGINLSSPKITVYLPKVQYASLIIDESTGNIEIPKDFKFENAEISLSTGDVDFFASASKSVKIKVSTGDICAENMSAGAIDLSASTGKVTVSSVTCNGNVTIGVSTGKAYLTDIACRSVISSGSTGDISLKNVIANKKFSIERSTGDVKFENCDAAEIFVETSTGDVLGTLLSDKAFITDTNTGDVSVPNSITGGRCEINTGTGDIKISVNS